MIKKYYYFRCYVLLLFRTINGGSLMRNVFLFTCLIILTFGCSSDKDNGALNGQLIANTQSLKSLNESVNLIKADEKAIKETVTNLESTVSNPIPIIIPTKTTFDKKSKLKSKKPKNHKDHRSLKGHIYKPKKGNYSNGIIDSVMNPEPLPTGGMFGSETTEPNPDVEKVVKKHKKQSKGEIEQAPIKSEPKKTEMMNTKTEWEKTYPYDDLSSTNSHMTKEAINKDYGKDYSKSKYVTEKELANYATTEALNRTNLTIDLMGTSLGEIKSTITDIIKKNEPKSEETTEDDTESEDSEKDVSMLLRSKYIVEQNLRF
jgi:hypothetical protein